MKDFSGFERRSASASATTRTAGKWAEGAMIASRRQTRF
jgi:hypothetical protein